MFLFIMTPRHLDTTKFKISISIWAFGCNAFALSIPFVSSTIRILLTNIPLITTRKVWGRSWSRSISTADTMSEMILFCFYYSKKLLCLENSFEFIWNPNAHYQLRTEVPPKIQRSIWELILMHLPSTKMLAQYLVEVLSTALNSLVAGLTSLKIWSTKSAKKRHLCASISAHSLHS